MSFLGKVSRLRVVAAVTKILDVDDGWSWFKLDQDFKEEGERMGIANHPTLPADEVLYSLRKGNKSGVTILTKNGKVISMVGRNNTVPVEKYHKAIQKFLAAKIVDGFDSGGYNSKGAKALYDKLVGFMGFYKGFTDPQLWVDPTEKPSDHVHEPVQTGMKKSWCKHCDKDMYMGPDNKYKVESAARSFLGKVARRVLAKSSTKASELKKGSRVAAKSAEADKVWYISDFSGAEAELTDDLSDALKFRNEERAEITVKKYDDKYPNRSAYSSEVDGDWVIEVDVGADYVDENDKKDDYGDTLPDILNGLVNEMDLTPDIDYSGRSMYGKECYAVRVSRHSYQRAMDILKKKVSSTRSDNMGMDMIIYWPNTPYEKIKNELDPRLQG
jgi:hypothetical protein